jgi:hypothetical protein
MEHSAFVRAKAALLTSRFKSGNEIFYHLPCPDGPGREKIVAEDVNHDTWFDGRTPGWWDMNVGS